MADDRSTDPAAPDMLSREGSVLIQDRPGFGNVLVAGRAFKAGEVIVHEEPLLTVPQLKPSDPLYKPLQAYFEQHGALPSVVLKIMAFFVADQETKEKVLQCFHPDPEAFAQASVVKQAKQTAQVLVDHPPLPPLRDWIHQQQQQQQQDAFDLITKICLIWITNGHSFRSGSALFCYGSKLTHTCAGPNTAYKTAAGQVAAIHGLTGSSSVGHLPAAGAAAAGAAAGYHIALGDISKGDILTTNYLGLGHKHLLSTLARQKILRDKFLYKCTCNRCTKETDLARGIPCPTCSAESRAPDKLLKEGVALPPTHRSTATSSSSSTTTGAGSGDQAAASNSSSSSSSGPQCGFIYCDQQKLLAGDLKPWTCYLCGENFKDDTAEIWGRWYTRSHDHIESDMESWVLKFDESLDTAPLIREPSSLHDRVLGIVRLLGPRQWAAWRLLLLGVELHCGVLEQAVMQFKVSPSQPPPTQAAAAAPAAAEGPQGPGSSSTAQQHRASDTAARLSDWVLRYCATVWSNVSCKYGDIEAGQLLGHHFTEASQVLIQVASTPGLFPAAAAESLMDAALQLQQQVLPGLKSILGQGYSPMQHLVPQAGEQPTGNNAATPVAAGEGHVLADSGGGGGGRPRPGRYVAASVKRYMQQQQQQQAAEAAKVQQVIAELKTLSADYDRDEATK